MSTPPVDRNPSDNKPRRTGVASIPRVVWTLGFVSMLMDVSSEMIHSLLPVFFVAVLGSIDIQDSQAGYLCDS